MMLQSTRLGVMSIAPNNSPSSPPTTTCFKSTQRQLTFMLVAICCAAICLQLPYTVLYLLNADKTSLWPDDYDHMTLHAKIYLSMKVAEMLATSNYAVNFTLYCVSGSAFRESVRRLCRPRQPLHRHDARYHAQGTS